MLSNDAAACRIGATGASVHGSESSRGQLSFRLGHFRLKTLVADEQHAYDRAQRLARLDVLTEVVAADESLFAVLGGAVHDVDRVIGQKARHDHSGGIAQGRVAAGVRSRL